MIRTERTLRYHLVAAVIILALAVPAIRALAQHSSPGEDRYLLLVVADGFRPDYMNLAPMPNLRALEARGTSYPNAWVGQLETETPTSHATIGTGVYPRVHGVYGFVWRDSSGPVATWMPSNAVQLGAGQMERLIESGGVPSLADVMHRAHPGSIVASISSEKFYAADAMGVGADYILYGKGWPTWIQPTAIGQHVPPASVPYRSWKMLSPPYSNVQDVFVTNMALHLLHTAHPRILLVNLPGTDIEGHITGGANDPRDMRQVVEGVDRAVGRLIAGYKQAGILDRTDVVFTADHGMLPNFHITPIKAMYASVRDAGAAVEDDFQSTGGYVFLKNPAQAKEVADTVAEARFPNVEGALYKVPARGGYRCQAVPQTAQSLGPQLTRAYIHLCDTVAGTYGPDVVIPYTADTLGLTVPNQKQWGTHGGLQWRVQHIPLIVAGPGVPHRVLAFPAKLVDIAPTVERLLGLPIPKGVNGVVLADALISPGESDTRAQRSVAASRMADVNALKLHSQQQHAIVLHGAVQ